MGCVPLHVPGLAVSVWPCWAVPRSEGRTVLVGGVVGAPLATTMLSATIVNVCDDVLLPICTELTPAEETVAVAEWYTEMPFIETSTVPVAAPVITTWTCSWAQVLRGRLAEVGL